MPSVSLRALPILVVSTLLLAAVPTAALASNDETAAIGITPLDHDGSWFDLELAPGDQVTLDIELANHGQNPIEARTYAADVYSLINGGMGVALQEHATRTDATHWIDYPETNLLLGPDSARRHTFTVEVPDHTAPGQYIGALVLQHEPDQDADRGELSIDQVLRQAVAVNITVPGATIADLALGDTTHMLATGRSALRTELENPGNQHLVPTGEAELIGPNGQSVTANHLRLGIVYAGTSTHVETILDQLLEPGSYTITTTLADASQNIEVTHSSSFEVVAARDEASTIPGTDRILEAIDGTSDSLLVLALIGLVLLLAIALVVVTTRGRRRSNRAVFAVRATADRQPGVDVHS